MTEGWGSSKSASAGGWGNPTDSEGSVASKNNSGGGLGNTTDSESSVASKNNSGGGWGNSSSEESKRSRTNSLSKQAEGWGASSSSNSSGWGMSIEKASDSGWGDSKNETSTGWGDSKKETSAGWGDSKKETSTGWGDSKKETSTGWGDSSCSSSPVPTGAGWGGSVPQQAVNESGASIWADSKAKPPPPIYIPPNAAQRRRWESKEEPVEAPSAKFLECIGIKPKSVAAHASGIIVPPRDPRLKKRISLGDYKQRPAPTVPKVAVVPIDSQPENTKEDVKLPDATRKPNAELDNSFEEPPSPPSPDFEPAGTSAVLAVEVPEDQILTAEQEEEFQKSILLDLEDN